MVEVVVEESAEGFAVVKRAVRVREAALVTGIAAAVVGLYYSQFHLI